MTLNIKVTTQLMGNTKVKTTPKKKAEPSIQSKGGKAVVKKYGKDHMKKLVEKRWKNAKKST